MVDFSFSSFFALCHTFDTHRKKTEKNPKKKLKKKKRKEYVCIGSSCCCCCFISSLFFIKRKEKVYMYTLQALIQKKNRLLARQVHTLFLFSNADVFPLFFRLPNLFFWLIWKINRKYNLHPTTDTFSACPNQLYKHAFQKTYSVDTFLCTHNKYAEYSTVCNLFLWCSDKKRM